MAELRLASAVILNSFSGSSGRSGMTDEIRYYGSCPKGEVVAVGVDSEASSEWQCSSATREIPLVTGYNSDGV
jgi:hypothetical protein